ncbi:pyridoxal phosphate-dependent aminotransferase [Domibacillus enclensis]|uniref:Aminotransferase n=1 Tax=Domibacillus enclensis TaxID=1017273 RepID=A0A1N6YG14_9BACI|nr:pyridoxal phosphate-dependent aminotransferase [Domibacillus enclensis]OXS77618.1 LL-diaminopimelate aminotransferase [Domibacillus enclensis]SIR13575.1 aminotransferase [Domibacillus enclensis]
MKQFEQSALLNALPDQFFAALSRKVTEYAAMGHDVINLGQGNPDQPTPEHIVASLKEAADRPDFHKYPPFQGQGFLKEAAAAFYKREYDVDLDPQTEIAILFGGKAGLVELPMCLMNEGEYMLVPDPGYPDYWSGAAMAKVKMDYMPLVEEKQFLPDYEEIGQERLDRAKLLLLNYPNNPTGAQATSAFFDETVQHARKHDLCVVHDFAYGGIGFDGQKPPSFLQSEGAKDIGVELYTLSKTYNMAGWRVAFLAGNQSVISAVNLLQDHLYVSLFSAIQQAAATALTESQDCVIELSDRYERRRNALVNACQKIGWKVTAPAGSFFAWLPVPKPYTSVEFSNLLLEKVHVVTAPGIGFGAYGEGYVRVGLLTDEERLEEAIQRIGTLHLFADE